MRFVNPGLLPQLNVLRDNIAVLRAEAVSCRPHMVPIDDWRTNKGDWLVLPLLAEEEDQHVYTPSMCMDNRRHAPETAELLDLIPGLLSAAFSVLRPGGAIAAHAHQFPNVSAGLALKDTEHALVSVGGVTRHYIDGEWTNFDYSYPHGVKNRGSNDRVMLLVAVAKPSEATTGMVDRQDVKQTGLAELEWIREPIEEITGQRVTKVRDARGETRGLSPAIKRVIEFADDTSAFAKVANRPRICEALDHEIEVYDEFQAPFMPTKVGHAVCSEGTILLLENLENAKWPPPWTDEQVTAVGQMLADLAAVSAPEWLTWMDGTTYGSDDTWAVVRANLASLVSLEIASSDWLDKNLRRISEAAKLAPTVGTTLVHMDVRSDNICFTQRGPVLLDWASTRLGHHRLDHHHFAVTLYTETGTISPELRNDVAPLHVAAMAGRVCRAATEMHSKVAPSEQMSRVRELAASRLRLACDLLGIESPDGARQ